MEVDWNFFRITPEHYRRLLSEQALETVEAIYEERLAEGLVSVHSAGADAAERPSFDEAYHLILRTDYDELDTLMTLEGDDGPVLPWPLGEGGIQLSYLGDVVYLLHADEVKALASALQLLLNEYLDRRFQAELQQMVEEAIEDEEIADFKELYPELKACLSDLVRFVQTASSNGEAILWDLS